jgi:Protein of unknown function (DUF3102)
MRMGEPKLGTPKADDKAKESGATTAMPLTGKAALAAIRGTDETILAENAKVIRALGKRAIADIIEIGRRLTESKEIAGHGGWLKWLDSEFGWTDRTALNFMQVYSLSLKSTFRIWTYRSRASIYSPHHRRRRKFAPKSLIVLPPVRSSPSPTCKPRPSALRSPTTARWKVRL